MARLKFDLKPLTGWRNEPVAEHNAKQREIAEDWEWAGKNLGLCGCGKFVPEALCMCSPEDRRRKTPERVREELEKFYRLRHLDGLAAKRKFPEPPRPEKHCCAWCGERIVHGRFYQRSYHDGREDEPDCRWMHDLHTRLEAQQSFLLGRDGPGCKACGALRGSFGRIWTDPTDERVAETWKTRAWIRERFAEQPAGPLTYIGWSTALEVDHFIALAVAWEAFPEPERRRWFFGPAALQLLCAHCHKEKTRADVAFIREAQQRGSEWARSEVIRRLNEAGLLKPSPV